MFKDILENINYIEGLYVYGSGELDQLSPINENIEKEEEKIYESPFPRKVPLHFISQTETIKLIKCGINTTIILSTEGNVYSFGSADNGALGHKESINALRIPLKFEATGISGGDCHGIAYNRENLAFWGQFRNSKKSLGKPYYDPTYFNKTHIKGEFFKKAISGINHVVILSENKNVFCFGSNEFGQIGVSPDKQIHHFQINKLYEKDVEDIFTGHEHSFLTKYEGGVKILKGWGNNGNGQLGTGSFVTRLNENYIIYVPTKVIFPGISKISVKKIEGGSSNTICLTEDNRVFIWGENDFSELGLQIKDKIIPRPKELLFFNPYSNPNNAIDDIYANNQYFYARNSMTNKVYSWGIGINYQLGNRKMKDENTPYLINHLFFKNLYINKLSLGHSHVAVFLTNKKNMPLNNNMSQKKSNEKSKKKISENKVIKRKNDELPGSKKEKEIDDYSTFKVTEEYITLNDSDQPKISAKKSLTEKKIKKGNYSYDNANIEQEEKDESKQNGNIKSKESKSNIALEKNIKNESKKINGNIIKSPNKKNANSINLQREKKMNSTKKDKLYDDIDINGKEINKNEEKINEKSSSKCDKRRRYPYKNDESEKKAKKENEEKEKEKKIQSKSKRRQNSAKKEEEKKDEDKDKEKIKEKVQLKNKNRKSDNRQEEEKMEKKEKKSIKSELSSRHKISLSKEKMEEKKSRKSSGSKSNKKEEEQYYKSGNKDEDENIDKIKDEKKGKKNSSSSNKNKKLKNEMVDGKEDEDNNENLENNSKRKYSYPKNIKNSEKKEVLKGRSKAKNSREKSKKKSKSKSKDKYPKRK